MPWGDCMGPWWLGSRGNKPAGYNPWCRRAAGYGRGLGMGYGRGYGRGYGYIPGEPFRQLTAEEERDYLETVARNLEEELKSLRAQIDKLQSKP